MAGVSDRGWLAVLFAGSGLGTAVMGWTPVALRAFAGLGSPFKGCSPVALGAALVMAGVAAAWGLGEGFAGTGSERAGLLVGMLLRAALVCSRA